MQGPLDQVLSVAKPMVLELLLDTLNLLHLACVWRGALCGRVVRLDEIGLLLAKCCGA